MLLRRFTTSSLCLALGLLTILLLAACDTGPVVQPTPVLPTATVAPTDTPPPPTDTPKPPETPSATPIPVADRGYVPILCYHHIRDWRKSDTTEDRAYIFPIKEFEAQLKFLKEEGYQGVTSGQVYEYYANGKPLPEKPIMLSFDDNDDNQYTNAVPLLKKYGFNATFFIMTVTIGQENYMSAEQLKELDKEGFDIQPHTWDHHMVTKYKTEDDWALQVEGPKKTLEDLLGHPTPYFAYPFGIYDSASAEKIKSFGYKAAFRLSEVMDDTTDPLFAVKRYIANPYFTDEQFNLVLQGNW
ncbi:MAG TPA: polysaccharide deacetylase family protein [Chloroflexia bacterium]|nr:polysaccharide deacetylase family protein [Chloroflexia bacterium]